MIHRGKDDEFASRCGTHRSLALASLAVACLFLAAGCETPELAASATGGATASASATPDLSAPAPVDAPLDDAAPSAMDSAPPADQPPQLPPAEPPADAPIDANAAANVPPGDNFAAAHELFSARCQRCHGIDDNAEAGGPEGPPPGGGFGGPGGGRGMRGPNLAHIGANPDKTVEWIADHIRDPKSHNQRSRMPAFANQLNDEEIVSLAELLASLK